MRLFRYNKIVPQRRFSEYILNVFAYINYNYTISPIKMLDMHNFYLITQIYLLIIKL